MLNQIVLVGRLTRNITVNESDSGIKVATIPLAIPRSFKNSDGTYDTDFVDCVAFDQIANNTSEYCEKGDIVGVKGRIQHFYLAILKKKKKKQISNLLLVFYCKFCKFVLLFLIDSKVVAYEVFS